MESDADRIARLEARLAELAAEIRAYPGPIARCDQHLPAMLEERSSLTAELQSLRKGPLRD